MSSTAAEVRAAFLAAVGDPPRDVVSLDKIVPILRAGLDSEAAAARAQGLRSFCKSYSVIDRTGKISRQHPPVEVTPAVLRTFISTYEYGAAFANEPQRYRAPLFHDAESMVLMKEWGTELYKTKNPAAIAAIIQKTGAFADPYCRELFAELLQSQMGFEAVKTGALIEMQRQTGPAAALHLLCRMNSARDQGPTTRPLCMGATAYEARDWERIQKRRARET